jgi:hypothetical protein
MPLALQHPVLKDIALDWILHALSHPDRQSIAAIHSAGRDELRRGVGRHVLSTISHHHRTLRASGLIRSELEARFPGLLAVILNQHQP